MKSGPGVEVIERCKRGDSEAFAVLYRKYNEQLIKWLATKIEYSEDIEDVAQDGWLKAMQKIGQFDGANFMGWLSTLAIREYISKKRLAKIPVRDVEDISRLSVPYEPYMEDDRLQVLRKAINEAPEIPKTVIILRTFYQLPHLQITKVLGINSVNTTLAIYRRALIKLKEKLSA